MNKTEVLNTIYKALKEKFGEGEARGIARIYSEDKEFPLSALSKEKQRILENDINQMLQNYPVQYLVGKAYFFDNYFKVNRYTLIPRSETEELVNWIIQEKKPIAPTILDIGTGSGCIPIILKKHLSEAVITALEISKDALDIARENADALNVDIQFIHLDFLNPVDRNKLPIYDLIVSNPPYIAKDEMNVMDQSTINYEPEVALFPLGDDPLIFYRSIAEFAENNLKPGGQIFLELNEFNAKSIQDIFSKECFSSIEIKMDLQGKNRMAKVLKKTM